MRASLSVTLALLSTSVFAAEEPSGCDKFKWPIDRERAALTAPDRTKLASGSEQAALPSPAITLALVAPADRICELQDRPQGGSLYDQPVDRRLGRPGAE